MSAEFRRSLLPGLGAVTWLLAMLWIGVPVAKAPIATNHADGFRAPDVCLAPAPNAPPPPPPPPAPAPVPAPAPAPAPAPSATGAPGSGAPASGVEEWKRAWERHNAALDGWKRVADAYLEALGGSPLPAPGATRRDGVEQHEAPASWRPVLARDDGDVRRARVTLALVAMAVVSLAGIAFGLRRTWAALVEDRASPVRFWVSLAVVAGTYLVAFAAPSGMPMLRAQAGERDVWKDATFTPPPPPPAPASGADGATCAEAPVPADVRTPATFAKAAREGRIFFSLVAAENPALAEAVETGVRHVLALAYACALALVGAYAATLRRGLATVADADARAQDLRAILFFAAVIFLVGMAGHHAVRSWALGFLDADRAFLAPALTARMSTDLLGIAIAYSLFMALTYYPGAFALLEARASLAKVAPPPGTPVAPTPPATDVLGILGRLVAVLAPVLGGVAADLLGKVLSG